MLAGIHRIIFNCVGHHSSLAAAEQLTHVHSRVGDRLTPRLGSFWFEVQQSIVSSFSFFQFYIAINQATTSEIPIPYVCIERERERANNRVILTSGTIDVIYPLTSQRAGTDSHARTHTHTQPIQPQLFIAARHSAYQQLLLSHRAQLGSYGFGS